MSETKELLRRGGEGFAPREDVMDALIRRRARQERNRRIATGVLAIVVALVSLAALIRAFGTVERPANEPTPAPKPEGIFANVAGWIAYGSNGVRQGPPGVWAVPPGIWAVDPTRPNDPDARIRLSDRPETPLAWSSDGSKLLIWRSREGPVGTPGCSRCAGSDWTGLFVLKADGTETRLVIHRPGANYIDPGGSFSPDGSEVVFAADGIYAVDADGGTPRLLAEGGGNPAFSPDGTKIAYFAFQDLTGNTLQVMNADGTGDRVLLDSEAVNCGRTLRPAWSPNGTKIAFSCSRVTGIKVVGADGSDLSTVIPNGGNPYWSPDGSRIAFEIPWHRDVPITTLGPREVPRLAIANADGTHVQVFQYAALAGPWNPWPSAVPAEPPSTGSGLAAPLVFAIALLVVGGVLIGGRRVRASIGATR